MKLLEEINKAASEIEVSYHDKDGFIKPPKEGSETNTLYGLMKATAKAKVKGTTKDQGAGSDVGKHGRDFKKVADSDVKKPTKEIKI